jgi:hypothetical protein
VVSSTTDIQLMSNAAQASYATVSRQRIPVWLHEQQ